MKCSANSKDEIFIQMKLKDLKAHISKHTNRILQGYNYVDQFEDKLLVSIDKKSKHKRETKNRNKVRYLMDGDKNNPQILRICKSEEKGKELWVI